MPPDGSVGVPRNTQLRALYFGTLEAYDEAGVSQAIDLSSLRLVPSTGEPILLTGSMFERPSASETWAISQPAEPLAPDTTYEVQVSRNPRDACSVGGLEWTTVSTFTTGEEEDHEAPSFAGLDDLSYGERVAGDSDCGGRDVIPILPGFRQASDGAPATRYNIYIDGDIAQPYVDLDASRELANASIYVDCGSMALNTNTAVAPGDVLELRAVDLAGNESPSNEAISIEASCAALPAAVPAPPATEPTPAVTASPTVPSDEPPSADAAAPAKASAAGCAMTHQREAAPVPLLMLAAVLSLLRRRR
jgi:hypothetical protein